MGYQALAAWIAQDFSITIGHIGYGTRTLDGVIAPGSIPIAYDSPIDSPKSLR